MRLVVSSKLGNGFIFTYLPTYIYKMSTSKVLKKKKKIEELLKEEFNYSIEQFIEEYKDSFSIKKFGKYYIISINEMSPVNKIMRAIDYGNTKVKPQHIFDKTFNYAQENLKYIHNMWFHNIKI